MINKYLANAMYGLAAVAWFSILSYESSLVETLASLAIFFTTASVDAFVAYRFLAHSDMVVLDNMMREHRVGVSLITAFTLWLAPAIIQGPWPSAVALGTAALLFSTGNYFMARWERAELAKAIPPFDHIF